MLERISRRYSNAMYDEAKSRGEVDQLSEDVEMVLRTIKANRDLELFFESPIIDKAKKTIVVKEIFEGKVSKLMLNLMLLLIQRQRDEHIVDILTNFMELKDEKDGIIPVNVTSAIELTDDEKNQIKDKIDSYTRMKSRPTFTVDPDLVGGFVVKIKDVILDASIRHQLEILRKRFKQGDIALN